MEIHRVEFGHNFCGVNMKPGSLLLGNGFIVSLISI